jgi:bisphosphoglycerate-independent phosphoglycerate mutase (AlkP superfamily)
MKRKQPDLLYIAYGETDDFAHDGNYQAYLKSARNTDALIMKLWEYTQQDPYYKDRTIFIVTTDHGRGTNPPETWKSHGSEVAGAGQVWLILFGKDIVPLGEVSREEQLYSTQIAPFIHEILGLKKPMQISYESLKRFMKE